MVVPSRQGVPRLGGGMGSVDKGSAAGIIPLDRLVEGLTTASASRLLPPTVPMLAPLVILIVVFPEILVAAPAAELSIRPHPKFKVTLPENFSALLALGFSA